MTRTEKAAQIGRWACLRLLTTLAAPAVVAAEATTPAGPTASAPPPAVLGASVRLTHGQKPEFHKAEDDGRYQLLQASVRGTVKDALRISLSQGVLSTAHPTPQTQLLDPSLGFAFLPNLLEGTGLTLSSGVSLSLGMSKVSRDTSYLGGGGAQAAVGADVGKVSASLGGAAVKHVRRYTLNPDGSPAIAHSVSGSVDLGYAWDDSWSASVSVSYRKNVKYAGPASYGFENGVSLAWTPLAHLSFELGLSTADAQLDAGGSANNEFDIYRQNQTEMYFSAAYAL